MHVRLLCLIWCCVVHVVACSCDLFVMFVCLSICLFVRGLLVVIRPYCLVLFCFVLLRLLASLFDCACCMSFVFLFTCLSG